MLWSWPTSRAYGAVYEGSVGKEAGLALAAAGPALLAFAGDELHWLYSSDFCRFLKGWFAEQQGILSCYCTAAALHLVTGLLWVGIQPKRDKDL